MVALCAEIASEYCLIVNKGAFVKRLTEHAAAWNFHAESIALWSSAESCAAWYEDGANLVVLTR